MSYRNSKSDLERAIHQARNADDETGELRKLVRAAEDFIRDAASEVGKLEQDVRREKRRGRD